MAVSIRTRFEIFKRDSFTCRYCGQCSPDVVLEVDHIIPCADGGSDDEMNLLTSCWDCNRGKSDVPLAEIMTGEEPHDKAVHILEKERQLREYDAVMRVARERRESDAWTLLKFWMNDPKLESFNRREFTWLSTVLAEFPAETIREFMCSALRADAVADLRYVKACVRTEREQRARDNG